MFDQNGKFLREWKHLGATQNIFITPKDEMWIITHRDNIENITYDTLAGRIMKIDLASGKILGAMESPGHWISVTQAGEIFIGSLTGNVLTAGIRVGSTDDLTLCSNEPAFRKSGVHFRSRRHAHRQRIPACARMARSAGARRNSIGDLAYSTSDRHEWWLAGQRAPARDSRAD